MSGPTWMEEFQLPEGSYTVRDIQDCLKYIMKNRKQWLIISNKNTCKSNKKQDCFQNKDKI